MWYSLSDLNIVTDFTASHDGLLSSHLEQLSITCPNLEQLNLERNVKCLEPLQGLRSIVKQCHNLQGLNLGQVHIIKAQDCTQLWELLSEIKMLNRLTVQTCTMNPFGKNGTPAQHSFIKLVRKFVRLENFQLKIDKPLLCLFCKHIVCENYPLLLSHFPSLNCFDLHGEYCNTIDIINQCKLLQYFRCFLVMFKPYSTVVPNPSRCLQHLHITSPGNNISDAFMDSVSSHGGLETISFKVFSVKVASITTVIQNSPKLYVFDIYTELIFDEKNNKVDTDVLKDTLKVKFSHRKLINVDGLELKGYRTRYFDN